MQFQESALNQKKTKEKLVIFFAVQAANLCVLVTNRTLDFFEKLEGNPSP